MCLFEVFFSLREIFFLEFFETSILIFFFHALRNFGVGKGFAQGRRQWSENKRTIQRPCGKKKVKVNFFFLIDSPRFFVSLQ